MKIDSSDEQVKKSEKGFYGQLLGITLKHIWSF